MEHVFLCLPCSYAWDGKGAQPGNCVMFTVPSALRFPALQDLVCHSGSVGLDTLPQLPLTSLLLSLSHSSYRVFSLHPQVGFFFFLIYPTPHISVILFPVVLQAKYSPESSWIPGSAQGFP